MAGVIFPVSLVDKLTGPARSMLAVLAPLNQQLQTLEKLSQQTVKLSGSVAATASKVATAKSPGAAPIPKIIEPAALAPIKLVNGELEALKQNLRDDKLAVTNLSASLRQLKAAEIPNLAAIAAVNRQLTEKKNSLADVQAKLVASGNAARFGSEGTNRLTTTLRELAEAAGGSGITGLADRLRAFRANAGTAASAFEELTGVGGKAALAVGGIGIAAVIAAAGVYKLVSAVAELVFSGASLAIDASESKNDTLDMLEAMLGTQKAAKSVYTQITALTKELAVSQAGVESSASALTAAGVTNEKMLVDAVRSIATVESVLKGGGSKIESIIERAAASGKFQVEARKLVGTGVQLSSLYQELAQRTGKGVKQIEAEMKAGKIKAEDGIAALSAAIDNKFGDLAKKQALDFGAQIQRLKDNFKGLFKDVDTGPFLDELSKLVSIFDTANPSGKALKGVVTSIFDGLFRAAAAAGPYVRIFFLGLELAALKVLTALKPLTKQFKGLFGGDAQDGPKKFSDIMILVAKGVGEFARWVVAVLPEVRSFVTTLDLATRPFQSMFKGIVGIIVLTGALVAALGIAVTWIVQLGTKAVEAGSNLVAGLIEGIRNAAGNLYATVKEVAMGALDTFQSFFKMGSPSRLMREQGQFLTAGVALGIKDGAPVANDNMERMLAVPPPRATTQGGRGGIVIHADFKPGSVVVQSPDAESVAELLPTAIADAFEQIALTTGTA